MSRPSTRSGTSEAPPSQPTQAPPRLSRAGRRALTSPPSAVRQPFLPLTMGSRLAMATTGRSFFSLAPPGPNRTANASLARAKRTKSQKRTLEAPPQQARRRQNGGFHTGQDPSPQPGAQAPQYRTTRKPGNYRLQPQSHLRRRRSLSGVLVKTLVDRSLQDLGYEPRQGRRVFI